MTTVSVTSCTNNLADLLPSQVYFYSVIMMIALANKTTYLPNICYRRVGERTI